MSQNERSKILRKLLLRTHSNTRLWSAVVMLCLGAFIMLLSIIVWTSFKGVLSGKYDKDSIGSTYLTISKPLPANEKLSEQKPNLFTSKEVRSIAMLDGVEDVGMFTSALFPVTISLEGEGAKFSTNLFLEAVPDRFIDKKPIDWQWQSVSAEVPIIVSTEFLNLYNFGYAANRGVPQLTKGTIKSLSFTLTIGQELNSETFNARVVGFSDRISSILVPQSFILYGNEQFATQKIEHPTRLILQVQDPSDKRFVNYVTNLSYEINTEQLRWNRLRVIVDTAVLGMGFLAVLLLVSGLVIFTLYIDLTLGTANKNIVLLVQLGYSPAFLKRFVYIRYSILTLLVMLVVAVLTIIAQVRIAKYLLAINITLPTFPNWEVWAALLCIIIVVLVMIYRTVLKGVR